MSEACTSNASMIKSSCLSKIGLQPISASIAWTLCNSDGGEIDAVPLTYVQLGMSIEFDAFSHMGSLGTSPPADRPPWRNVDLQKHRIIYT